MTFDTLLSALANIESLIADYEPDEVATLVGKLAEAHGRLLACLTASKTPDTLLTAQEVAARLRVPVRWVWENGRSLGATKIGNRSRYPERQVRRYIRSRTS